MICWTENFRGTTVFKQSLELNTSLYFVSQDLQIIVQYYNQSICFPQFRKHNIPQLTWNKTFKFHNLNQFWLQTN
uniref:Uncharacterized protein n=1 Tax=Anguilla anguilla TaxID=7936 RepID=A0A0E9UQ81_ANGAN